MNDLSASVYRFLQQLDLCFNNDLSHTETVTVEQLAEALLGKKFTGDGCNLTNLAVASDDLRRELIYAINREIRHGDQSIYVNHL